MHSSLTAVDYLILIILSFTNQVTSAIIVCIAVSNRHHANAACVTKIKSKQAQVDGGRTSLFGQHGVHMSRGWPADNITASRILYAFQPLND